MVTFLLEKSTLLYPFSNVPYPIVNVYINCTILPKTLISILKKELQARDPQNSISSTHKRLTYRKLCFMPLIQFLLLFSLM